jgi:DNA adenine methylase
MENCATQMSSTKFEEMKVSELKKYCKENGIKGISGLKRQDIINIINNKNISLSPIIKWSGGKKDEIKKFIDYIPKTYYTYLEPFIGGGAVYFHINPQKAVINDVHTELADFYQSIKNGYSNKIYNFMKEHPNQEEIYYKVRSYKPSNQLENAQRFYYLRKTCFRGMLRYNSKGEFNIPYGRYKNYNFEDIKNKEYEKLLKNTEVLNKDFKYIFDNYNSKDNFMFLDPPYDSEFTDYGYCSFGKEEHKKLAKCFKETKIKCLMIIGKTKFISELYDGYIVGEYDKNYRFKLHSGRVGDEINTKHLIIMNY